MKNPLREQYEKAQQLGKLAFAERPYFGSPAAPAQAETNASQIWGTSTRASSSATSTRAGGRSLLRCGKPRCWATGAGSTRPACAAATRRGSWTTPRSRTSRASRSGRSSTRRWSARQGKVAIEGLTLKLAEDEYLFTQSAGPALAGLPAAEKELPGRARGRHAGLHLLRAAGTPLHRGPEALTARELEGSEVFALQKPI